MSTAQLRYEEFEELASVDRIWHLRQTRLIDGLSLADLNAIVSVCTDRIYPQGEMIFNQGDPADSLFILNRGCARICVVDAHDREKILGFYTTGDIFGEDVLGPKEYFGNQAMAHEECWVSIISRDQFVNLIRQRVSIGLNYVKILSQRLLEAREEIEAHSFLDTEHRLGKMLLKLAEHHGKPIFGEEDMVKLKISLTHDQLARLIGANRPHVSMIISKFKKKGWIGYQSRKLLINRNEIQRLLQPMDYGTARS